MKTQEANYYFIGAIVTAIIIIFLLTIWVTGCSTLGISDRQTMMEKWQSQKPSVELLADINEWANWNAKGNPTEPGKCVDQTEAKLAILKDLNIPAKRMHCTIDRDLNKTGHSFVIASLNDKNYLLDNGTISNVVWVAPETLSSTWGISDVENR